MPSTKYIIELTEADRKCLTDIVKKGNSPARTIMSISAKIKLSQLREK